MFLCRVDLLVLAAVFTFIWPFSASLSHGKNDTDSRNG